MKLSQGGARACGLGLIGKAPSAKSSQVCEHKAGNKGRLEKKLFMQVHF